ncbi:NETI motif-containing protein [Macrococcus equi]|uniref:NETI motif-containing protein n=1 Tax=Macrococcus equi TaxID=3395462 RepID=UPI0039BEA363
MKFEVKPNETIAQCLERMKAAGYTPVKRFQKPVFLEKENGEIELYREQIIFTGKKIDN